MAIRLADTARPNNYVDAEHKGTFPVAYAEDIWFEDGTRLSEKSFDGQSIQVEELPIASADELEKIYQYVGETGTYTKGYFYECVSNGGVTPTYSWKEVIGAGSVTIVDDFPTSNIENIIYRTQASTFTVIFDQSNSQMILSKKGFTYTEDTVDGVFIREWTTNIETYVKIDSEYKRVNKIIYKLSPELKRYHKIMYNDEVLHEASESSGSRIFTFKTVSAYYAGDNINQKIERLAKYSDTPFTGTQAEWDALSTTEKLTYKQVNITDDESGIGRIKSKTFSGTSDNNGFLLIDDNFDADKVVVLGIHYPSGTPPYRAVPIVSTNGNKWFLNVSDLLTGESLPNITITNAIAYYVEL